MGTGQNRRLFSTLACLAGVLSFLSVAILAESSDALEPPAPFTIFAASSLTDVLEDAAKDYLGDLPADFVALSVAGSGTLARQIEAGAPAHVFISADSEWIEYLASRNIIEAGTATPIARNRLVLVTRSEAKLSGTIDQRLRSLAARGRIAIGESETVPAGRYAAAALKSLDLWSELQPVLVPTNSVRVALALVSRGEVEGAIVYETDAELLQDIEVQAVFLSGLHPPITYWAVVLDGSPWTAHDFVTSLGAGKYSHIFFEHGFISP